MQTLRGLGIASIAVLIACTLDQNSNPFGSGGSSPVSTAAPVEADTGDEESSTGDAGDDEEDDGAHDGDDSSSDGGVDPSTTMPPTTDPTADPTNDPTGVSTDDGGDPTGAMPGAGGLYDHCLQPEDCGPGTTACLQIVDDMNMPIAGFCTHEGCTDPNSDCAAPTTGDAQPFCLPVMVGNMQDAVCALDCGGGEQCPTGTMCIQLEVGWVCA